MLDLSRRLAIGARTPPPEELAQAFVEFFESKKKGNGSLEEIQAQHAIATLQHLQKTWNEAEGFGPTIEELRMALLIVLSKPPPKATQHKTHNKLAKLLFQEMDRRRESIIKSGEPVVPFWRILMPFIQALLRYGDSLYARDLVEENWEPHLKDRVPSPWKRVFGGLIQEGRDEELQKTIKIMQKINVPFDSDMHQQIILAYARLREDIGMTKKWYMHPIANGGLPTMQAEVAVLKLCLKRDELDWGDAIFKSMLEKNPSDKWAWNMIFQWAAANGKGVDEIERMMKIMIRRNEGKENGLNPDIETINGLVEISNSRNDPYTAERYVALGQRWGFQPNAHTYLLQLDYRIKVKDLDGARAAYRSLQGEELAAGDDLPLINKLIVALCAEKRQNYDAIMGLIEDLTERKARFESETVAALSRLHLQRGEMDDLVDLLNTHTFNYGIEQRESIRNVLLQHCLDRSTPTPRAWETYNILRQTFSETSIHIRTALMNEFFARNRCDMATHVFGHMRQQQIKSLRPSIDTYAACLTGIGRAGDLDSLGTVHNMIKLDSEIEPNTKLYNALMLGYIGCGEPLQARTFWEDILYSREGPTYSSIQIALQSCERAPFGERLARDIWSKLKKFEIEVTREIYAAYVGALAGQSLYDECVKLVDAAEKDVGYKPDALL